MSDQGIVTDAATAPTTATANMPQSTPSTWAGIYVLGSLVGLFLIRRSFRRMS